MQQKPLVSTFRIIGLCIGMVLFVFMAYRSGESVNSKAAVEGVSKFLQGFTLPTQANNLKTDAHSDVSALGTMTGLTPSVSKDNSMNVKTHVAAKVSHSNNVASSEGSPQHKQVTQTPAGAEATITTGHSKKE